MIEFLNTTFSAFDGGIFNAMHRLAESAGSVLTSFFKIITLIGEKGLIFFAIAVVLMLFAKTRKLGICMFGAVACGAILTNLVLKDIIARPRPFESSVLRRRKQAFEIECEEDWVVDREKGETS